MGLRFRKSYKIAPGVKFNVNKKSVGMTFGGKGVHYTVNSSGRRTTSVGIPGTGLYYTDVSRSNRSAPNRQQPYQQPYSPYPNYQQKNIPDECPCCGAKNENHDAFCKICGQPLSEPTHSQQAYVPPVYVPPAYNRSTAQAKPRKQPNKLINTLIGLIFLFVICFALLIAYQITTNKKNLTDYKVHVEDVMNGTGDQVIGQYAYISISKPRLENTTQEDFKNLCAYVGTQNYNWFSVITGDNSTGIIFTGCDTTAPTYGILNNDKSLYKAIGNITLESDGNYHYYPVDTSADLPSVPTAPDNTVTDTPAADVTPDNSVVDAPADNTTDNTANNTAEETKVDMVWYVDGGSRYHSRSSCSNMGNPKQITKEEAESMGLTPCKRCY
nr:MAG TPA: Protein of unknown function (DUF4236) [Caudoviricetes sp.]